MEAANGCGDMTASHGFAYTNGNATTTRVAQQFDFTQHALGKRNLSARARQQEAAKDCQAMLSAALPIQKTHAGHFFH
jgi:hypothetical protein